MLPRIIPCLLLRNSGFVKTVNFKKASYLGDPLNILKIFNEKEVDEILILDIDASKEEREPSFPFLAQMARECFMPIGYGGGLSTLAQVEKILKSGFEKISLNTSAVNNPKLIEDTARVFGSQSVVVSIDAKRSLFGGYQVVTRGGTVKVKRTPVELAKEAEARGAGEILINSVDKDGTMTGYDMELVKQVAAAVSVPVIACGGAASLEHMAQAVLQGGASAAAAGSLFVYQGPHRAVLINAPAYRDVKARLAGWSNNG